MENIILMLDIKYKGGKYYMYCITKLKLYHI